MGRGHLGVRALLRLEGYEVVTAFDKNAAWREMSAARPDAVLLDLWRPTLDVLSFLRRLRAHGDLRHTPVAIVTGDYAVDDATMNALRELRADVYFKPVWLEDLVAITRNG